MSSNKFIRAVCGSVTMSQLHDDSSTLYIIGLSDYYDTEYKTNKYNNTQYEVGRRIDRRAKESLYIFLMENFSSDGITEPKNLSAKVMEKFGPDEFFDKIVELPGIGAKTGILATIAITGISPSITKNLAEQVCEAVFVSNDKNNLVSHSLNIVKYRGDDEYSTALDEKVVMPAITRFSEVVRQECGFRKEKIPSVDEITEKVLARLVRLDNGKVMLREQYNREQALKALCDERVEAGDLAAVEEELQSEADGADIVTAGLDDYQYNAVKMVVESTSKVSVIKGKAGTGKSHLISALFRAYNGQCALTAYQNSACDVLSRRVGGYSMCGTSIKSLISLSMKLDANRKFAAKFRGVRLVIIDEASQIGTRHLEYVLNIINNASPDAKLVLVGDVLQTRPVCTYGLPFVHLANNGLCPVADLSTFHRTNGLGILQLCEKIRAATDRSKVIVDESYEGVTISQGPHTAKYWNEFCTAIADDYADAGDDITKCITIAETNNYCNYINWLVTSKLFGDELPSDIGMMLAKLPSIRKGMVVRSTTNSEGAGWKLTNGTRYFVVDLDESTVTLKNSVGETMRIPLCRISTYDLQVAYAVTVHKSQGDEATNVRYVFPRNTDFSNAFATDKTLKYVALSRAQESITLHEVYRIDERPTGHVTLYLNDSKHYDMSI